MVLGRPWGSLMPAVALVAEGPYDEGVLKDLIRRIRDDRPDVHSRICRGSLGGRYVRQLRELRHEASFEKALVVSDAHGRSPEALVAELRREIQNVWLPFPVHYVVVVQELEAWLLADHLALDSVVTGRGGRGGFQPPTHSPESADDPKRELLILLGNAGVSYTQAVAREIAQRSDLQRIAYWSESFRRFQNAVNDP